MSLKKLFGAQVKLIRKYRNMTQEELSEHVDIDIRQLARIEAGASFATSETIEKLTKALNVTYKEMFDFNINDRNMTCSDMSNYLKNYTLLNKLIQKLAHSNEKVKYITLAVEALEKRSALEKLKSIIFGMTLK